MWMAETYRHCRSDKRSLLLMFSYSEVQGPVIQAHTNTCVLCIASAALHHPILVLINEAISFLSAGPFSVSVPLPSVLLFFLSYNQNVYHIDVDITAIITIILEVKFDISNWMFIKIIYIMNNFYHKVPCDTSLCWTRVHMFAQTCYISVRVTWWNLCSET